jgi:RNA polymerase sigma-70 factor (ECF subfamily)
MRSRGSWGTDAPSRWRARDSALARSVEDAEAFRQFYVATAERVVRFFLRRTRDPELSADLAAETFAVALQRRRQFRGESEEEAEAWLFAIARSQLSRSRRRRVAERRALERLGREPIVTVGADIERVEELAALREVRVAIGDAIDRLGAEQAYAVRQRIVHERGYDDLAAELGVSEDVVRARVSRGLRALSGAQVLVIYGQSGI